MKKNNIKILVILIVAVFLLIFLINTALNKVDKENPDKEKNDTKVEYVDILNSDEISEEDKAIIEKYPTNKINNIYIQKLDVEERKETINSIDEVLKAINDKDYSWLYTRLDKQYKELMFPTEEEFKGYLNSVTSGATDYTCEYYDIKYYGNEAKFVSPTVGQRLEVKLEYTNDEQKYNLMFEEGIISIERRNGRIFYTNGIVGTLNYEIQCNNTMDYIFTLKNSTNKSVECSFVNSKLSARYDEGEIISPKDTIELKAGEEEKVRFSFNTRSMAGVIPEQLNISCTIDEKEYTDTVRVNFTEDDWDF